MEFIFLSITVKCPVNNSSLCPAVQEAVRKAQEELAKQKEVIMSQDKELKVKFLPFSISTGVIIHVFIHTSQSR